MSDLTPMLQQYRKIKEQYHDAILFFRLGDFYEMFFEDAETGARELEITLTSRPAGRSGPIPMCGVPYHAAETYMSRLVSKGYRVAICEQQPGDENGRSKLLEREITRVVTPGTILNDEALSPKENNYLAALAAGEGYWGLAFADVSTGEFYIGSFPQEYGRLEEELRGLHPAELITLPDGVGEDLAALLEPLGITGGTHECGSVPPEEIVRRQFGAKINDLTPGMSPAAEIAAGLLLSYLQETQRVTLSYLQTPRQYRPSTHMVLDATTKYNLELVSGRHTGTREGSLLKVLDYTRTPMGGRLFRRWLETPLAEVAAIAKRQEAVEKLVEDRLMAAELQSIMGSIRDLERLSTRAAYGTASPRDLLALKDSLSLLPALQESVSRCGSGSLSDLSRGFDPLADLSSLLEAALEPSAPASLEQGGIIKAGFDAEVDRLRQARDQGQGWIAGLESRERERTGIKSLKVGFNRVFGYYLEITKSNLGDVPSDYRRKQTLVNAERFVTPELEEYEEAVLQAEEKLATLEQRLFNDLRRQVGEAAGRIRETAARVAAVDCLAALAEAAVRYHYVRPQLDDSDQLEIIQGLHPVVEQFLGRGEFVPNDTFMDQEHQRLIILTGPNMAGKSTYMRQVAILVIMAQIGSFIPAVSARIGVVDRIFTRVGATDDLIFGRSTFLMEMLECRAIIEGATERSLVVMDEVGRGTSTYDGLSLARSLLEYIHSHIRCRTIFSTHFHELADLADSMEAVVNQTISVSEKDGRLVFLRTVVPGRASKSYGIQVAALAGLPTAIVERARQIADILEHNGISPSVIGETAATSAPQSEESTAPVITTPEENGTETVLKATETGQLKLFPETGASRRELSVLKELAKLDLINMTPMEAMNRLYALQCRLKKSR